MRTLSLPDRCSVAAVNQRTLSRAFRAIPGAAPAVPEAVTGVLIQRSRSSPARWNPLVWRAINLRHLLLVKYPPKFKSLQGELSFR